MTATLTAAPARATAFTVTTVENLAATPASHRCIVVLNASNEPLKPVGIKRAMALLLAEKAHIVKADENRYVRSASGEQMWPWPVVIRLARYIYIAFEKLHAGPAKWTKRGVLERDGYRCGYCLEYGAFTVDHITPVSKGGRSTWLNTVAACQPCNGRKANRTPEQAGMPLKATPYAPRRR